MRNYFTQSVYSYANYKSLAHTFYLYRWDVNGEIWTQIKPTEDFTFSK